MIIMLFIFRIACKKQTSCTSSHLCKKAHKFSRRCDASVMSLKVFVQNDLQHIYYMLMTVYSIHCGVKELIDTYSSRSKCLIIFRWLIGCYPEVIVSLHPQLLQYKCVILSQKTWWHSSWPHHFAPNVCQLIQW